MTLTAAGQPALFATVVGANGGIYRLSDVPAVAGLSQQDCGSCIVNYRQAKAIGF